jgi:hypothetical protein
MVELVDLLRAIRRWRDDVALVTHTDLTSIELSQGYYTWQWIAGNAMNRDRWRYIRAIQNRAPFSSVIPEDATGDVEYRHAGRLADGLGAAHLSDGLAISLRLDAAWETAWVTTIRSILDGDDSGDLMVSEESVEVRHATTCDHATCHKNWIQEAGRDGLTSGGIIWQNRGAVFPHLTFLPRVEDDLRDAQQSWVRPIANQLFKLEQAVADWKPGHEASPRWMTRVTGESETRQSLCEFTDLDGVVRTFELHARITPGERRIHFRLVPEDGTVRVAYIGRKLGI